MCDLCKNNLNRSYSHAKTRQHYKLLLKVMRERKATNYYNKKVIN